MRGYEAQGEAHPEPMPRYFSEIREELGVNRQAQVSIFQDDPKSFEGTEKQPSPVYSAADLDLKGVSDR